LLELALTAPSSCAGCNKKRIGNLKRPSFRNSKMLANVPNLPPVPPLAIGGEHAFLTEYDRRMQTTGLAPSTQATYKNMIRKVVGNGTVETCTAEATYDPITDKAIKQTQHENQYRLIDLPAVNAGVPEFVTRLMWRHGWRKKELKTNGAVEAAFAQIYILFPEINQAGATWTALFPLTQPEDTAGGGDEDDIQEAEQDDVEEDEADSDYPVVVVDNDAQIGDNAVVVPDPPPPPQWTFTLAGKRVKINDLALGTVIIGDPGSGKTCMIKHLVDQVTTQIDSIKNIVIVDLKGDLSQLVYEASSGSSESPYDDVFFEVMTFSSAVGTWATLSGFDKCTIDKLEAFDLSSSNKLVRRDATQFASLAKSLAQDVLLDVVVKTKEGKDRLGGGMEVPSARGKMTSFGTFTAKDEQVLAERLSTMIVQIFLKCRKAKVPLPRSYNELFKEIECATESYCRRGIPAPKIDENSLDQEDFNLLSKELSIRVNDVSWSALYEPESIGEDASGPDAVVPLSGARLLAPPPHGFKKRITIVNAALYGTQGVDDLKRRTIASTVITRMERQAAVYPNGSQESPTSMLIIDEASFVMPNSGQKATGPDVLSTVGVKNILKLHRDKGMSVVLATQRPKDLHTEVRSIVTGLRMIGKFNGDPNEKKMVMESIVKEEALRGKARDELKTLKPHQFVMINNGAVDVVRSKPLKRLHESSKRWAQPDTFTLTDLMSDDAATADAAKNSHPLADFTRNVRARFA
jgi:hypothetical protein